MTTTAHNQLATPGIGTALHVPVTQGSKEGESALFQGVAERISRVAAINGAAFCSREGNSTVVNRVNTSRLFGLFGLFGLSG